MQCTLGMLIRAITGSEISKEVAGEIQSTGASSSTIRLTHCAVDFWREMPKTIEYSGISFRRISDITTRKDILTRFGKVELTRARYRKGRDGETIFSIEKLLGNGQGVGTQQHY